MDMRMTPGVELVNGKCETSYPQEFVKAQNPYEGKPRHDRFAQDMVEAKQAMGMVWK